MTLPEEWDPEGGPTQEFERNPDTARDLFGELYKGSDSDDPNPPPREGTDESERQD